MEEVGEDVRTRARVKKMPFNCNGTCVGVSVCLSVCLICLVCLVCLPVCASVRLSVCLPVSVIFVLPSRQLDDLVAQLAETEPHYIKCIKPNSAKAPGGWTSPLVIQQLRYSGVLEVRRR